VKKQFLNQNHRQRSDLLNCYQAALQSVHGKDAVAKKLERLVFNNTVSLIAIGKAASSMAQGVLHTLDDQVIDGLVITKTGHFDTDFPEKIQCLEASHPIPDESSLHAGKTLVNYCQKIPADQDVIFCISGGASSLVEVLPMGFSLQALQQKNQQMIANGLSIEEINLTRKKHSLIKGGKLAKLFTHQRVEVLAISDVKGDDLSVIGSGLLYQPNTNALIHHHVIANLALAKSAACQQAENLNYRCNNHAVFLGQSISTVADLIFAQLDNSEPSIHLWGGEPVMELPKNPGRGGRNQHLALTLAQKLKQRDDILILVAGTDGTDGPTQDAGALIDGGSIVRGEDAGFNAASSLKQANSGEFLEASGDLITTGPTQTNVMDLVIGLKLNID
jgi:hydroxypyruvate reductase